MKNSVDNKADEILIDNSDSSNLDSLQSLRNELSTKYFKNQLDAYSLYVYVIQKKIVFHKIWNKYQIMHFKVRCHS